MQLNADFSKRACVSASEQRWIPSPQPGVDRILLDRIGAEKARATSLVRYSPGSQFPAHQHPGGEEILVLSGTFADENGHYPAGWYLRNPPGSFHSPASPDGSIIFVKLWQMHATEKTLVRINTGDAESWQREGSLQICPLYSDGTENVRLCRLKAGDTLNIDSDDGSEVLLVSGQARLEGRSYQPHSWWRFPVGDAARFTAGESGAVFYIKTGHLKNPVNGHFSVLPPPHECGESRP